ncbi:aminoacyl-histidine dipeptidase [Bacteroidia bacterium]|nr:aminoacyl-histidine dipeptidase [Bacteroidia bacterium]
MSNEITKLAPQRVWQHFYEMTQIPHPSKKEEKMTVFAADFGKKLGLYTDVDKMGNVLIRKPATKGMENRKGVILQGHLDMVMVPQTHTAAIDAYIDGDWVRARGTTLGADNGIGSAAAMAILESTDIPHPQIEALFTVDEETGMTGAAAIAPNWLKGDILINLDSEEVDELCIGCAGGLDAMFADTYTEQQAQGNAYELTISGLKSGHSGMEIVAGRANAIKLSARVLKRLTEKFGVQLASLKAGEVRNAIPCKALAVVVCGNNVDAVKSEIAQLQEAIQNEYKLVEGNISIDLKPTSAVQKVVEMSAQKRYIYALLACPNDVIRMSNAIPGLVETSTNLALVSIADGKFSAHCLLRSSIASAITYLSETMESVLKLAGITCSFTGGYPGWNPNINSPILKLMSELYEKMFNKKPNVRAVHAGLECGLLGNKYPNWDMISCGPNILNPHSTAERVQISSVERWWNYLLEVLKSIPA